jgi:hypothetical protein
MPPSLWNKLTDNAALLDHLLVRADKNFAVMPPTPEPETTPPLPMAVSPDENEDEFLLEEVTHLNGLLLRMKTQMDQMMGVFEK